MLKRINKQPVGLNSNKGIINTNILTPEINIYENFMYENIRYRIIECIMHYSNALFKNRSYVKNQVT